MADPHFSTIRKLAAVIEVNPRDLVQMDAPPVPVEADGSAPPAPRAYGDQDGAMQDLGYELPRILLLRTPVNKPFFERGDELRFVACSEALVGQDTTEPRVDR